MSSLALCIPAYQAADHLPRLLISAREQWIPFNEIWVYDDASSDDTAEVAERHGARVMRGSKNMGCSAGKNILLRHAKTEWIHFHDSDDLLLPNFTTLAHEWISRLDCPDVVLFDYEYRDNDTDQLIAASDFCADELEDDPIRYAILNQINPFCGVYRREQLLKVGGYDIDNDILFNEDVAFHCKLALEGLSFSSEKRVSIINYRMAQSMSSSNQIKCLQAHVEVMRRIASKAGDRYPKEIKFKLWHAAKVLASLLQWDEMSKALYIAESLTPILPQQQSMMFVALVRLLGVNRAFWLREQGIRLIKPELRKG